MINNLGQLFFTGIEGLQLSDFEADFIKKHQIGGIVLFERNFSDPAQLAELINNIQQLREDHPLFISVDHEGGRVNRFKKHFTHFPPMGELAKLNSPKSIYEIYQIFGRELKACGINLNFAPVCDVVTNSQNKVIGDRSFGRDPKFVEKFVSAAIRGLHAEGILACPKHFPGHGSTKKDSHYELPSVTLSMDEMKKGEWIPFYKASRSRAEFMMIGHLRFEDLDRSLPSSLSPKIYNVMRDYLKFKKIIITDDLEMKAISKNIEIEKAGFSAIEAGADCVLFKSFENCVKSYEYLTEMINKQNIARDIIDQKIRKVFKCKEYHLKDYKPVYIPKISAVLSDQTHKKYLTDIMEKLDQCNDKAS